MRRRVTTTTMAVAVVALLQAPARAQSTPATKVRPYDETARAIVAEALQLSPTVVRLIERLEASDVVIQVASTTGLPWPTGELRFVTRTPFCRIVRIRLERHRRRCDQIATFGHELQHAVEIAEAPEVVDSETLQALYRRIGLRTERPDHYETAAALAVEWQVAFEVYRERRAAKERTEERGVERGGRTP